MDINHVKDALKDLQKGIDKLGKGPMSYYLECLTKAHDLLVNHHAPFLVGHRVELAKAPNIGPESGWRSVKHCLIEGARGTVRSVEVQTDGLVYGIVFDYETYINHHGVETAPEKKGAYPFHGDDIRPIRLKQGETKDIFDQERGVK